MTAVLGGQHFADTLRLVDLRDQRRNAEACPDQSLEPLARRDVAYSADPARGRAAKPVGKMHEVRVAGQGRFGFHNSMRLTHEFGPASPMKPV